MTRERYGDRDRGGREDGSDIGNGDGRENRRAIIEQMKNEDEMSRRDEIPRDARISTPAINARKLAEPLIYDF